MSDNFPANINWNELFWTLQSETAQAVLQKIPRSTLEYLLNKDNGEKVTASAQKSLEKSQGKQVAWAEAEILVKKMQEVVRKIIANQA